MGSLHDIGIAHWDHEPQHQEREAPASRDPASARGAGAQRSNPVHGETPKDLGRTKISSPSPPLRVEERDRERRCGSWTVTKNFTIARADKAVRVPRSAPS